MIIHQELALAPNLSIAENIFLGNEQSRRGLIDWNRTNHAAAALLRRVGLAENPVTPVIDLGVGKQQLVEIAKALSKQVRLLILDEPTAALNDEDSAHLLDLLRGLRDEGITCVIISHKLNEVMAIADRVTILRDGRTITHAGHGGRRGHRGPDHLRHGRPRPGPPLPAARAAHRRGGAADRGLDRAQPHPARPGRGARAPTWCCAAARSSAWPG